MESTANNTGGEVRERWTAASSEVTVLGALQRFYRDCVRAKVGTLAEEKAAMMQRYRQITGKSGSKYRRKNAKQPGIFDTKCWRDPARVVELTKRTLLDVTAAYRDAKRLKAEIWIKWCRQAKPSAI